MLACIGQLDDVVCHAVKVGACHDMLGSAGMECWECWQVKYILTALKSHFFSVVCAGHFLLEFKGLRPGRYHYKYIIDNTWALDPFAPKDLDSAGNWNNALEVHAPPKIESVQEQQHFAALEAMFLAFEAKLGLQYRYV